MDQKRMKQQLEFAQLKSKELDESEKNQLVIFLLVFNVFEARLFKDGRGVNNLLKKISDDLVVKPWFSNDDLQAFDKFFKDRYVNDGEMKEEFYDLRLCGSIDKRDTDRGNCVAVLTGKEERPQKVLYCYFCIAYRFRNNLFHGNKNVMGLNLYYKCFQHIVEFLIMVLGDMVDNNFDGLRTKY